jgi:hypothetical protein
VDRSADVPRRARAALAGALALWAFFAVTKHWPAFEPYSPFDVDPYDIVGSFTFQIAISIAVLNLLRLHLIARSGARERVPYVARGIVLVSAAIAVTMASDAVAVARSGVRRPRSAVEAATWAAIVLLASFSILLARGLRGRCGAAGTAGPGEFEAVFRRAAFRGVDPQSHPVRFATLLSAGTAVAVTTAQVVGEGPAPTLRQTIAVIAVFLAVEFGAVFVGFLSIGRWLGLAGPLRRSTASAAGA